MNISSIHRTILKVFIVIGISMFGIWVDGNLQAQLKYSPDSDSRIWIEGSSNVNQFTCTAERYEGEAQLPGEAAGSDNQMTDDGLILEFRIPVQSFECGRSRMNRDLYNALKAGEFLYISFEYKDAINITPATDQPGVFTLEIAGTLTVAGTSREILFDAQGHVLDNMRLRANGKKEIRMTDFDVEPPTGLLGMVRARDRLTVHFDLFASPDPDSQL